MQSYRFLLKKPLRAGSVFMRFLVIIKIALECYLVIKKMLLYPPSSDDKRLFFGVYRKQIERFNNLSV